MNRKGRSAGRLVAGLSLASVVVGACAWHEPARVEEDFGRSVRQMVQEQIYDKQAAAEPASNAPDLLDGSAAGINVDGYRQSVREARTFREQGEDNPIPVTGQGGTGGAD